MPRNNQNYIASVAPMMDWTDRYCRWFHRQLSSHALLYTEMVVADAVIYGERDYLLGFDDCEHPVALQIGGSDPAKLAKAAKIGEDFGYAEININIGCPSDRVQAGRFGACLMQEPALVADCFKAMQDVVDVPVTVKCRLGVDDQEVERSLPEFLQRVSEAGCTRFIIHARKAWLKGLSPKENRDVPPLDYDLVRQMKADFAHLTIELNGGLADIDTALNEAAGLDGFMLGRAAYQTPWILTQIDSAVYGEADFALSRAEIAQRLIGFAQRFEAQGANPKAIPRHITGLFHGLAGARHWRRALSENMAGGGQASLAIRAALEAVLEAQRRAA